MLLCELLTTSVAVTYAFEAFQLRQPISRQQQVRPVSSFAHTALHTEPSQACNCRWASSRALWTPERACSPGRPMSLQSPASRAVMASGSSCRTAGKGSSSSPPGRYLRLSAGSHMLLRLVLTRDNAG